MELSLLLVADYANTTSDGKLNVMGIFGNITAQSFPATHPEMYVIAQLSVSPAEYGRRFKFELKLLGEDGEELGTVGGENEVPRGEKGQRISLNHVMRLVNVMFPRAGIYEFAVLIDNDLKGTLAIDVNQLPEPGVN
jgi:hypothetical protein